MKSSRNKFLSVYFLLSLLFFSSLYCFGQTPESRQTDTPFLETRFCRNGINKAFFEITKLGDIQIRPCTGRNVFVNGATVATGTSGETNTGSNLGTGAQIFKQKTGVDLQFRSIIGTNGLTVTQNANDLSISGANFVTNAVNSNGTGTEFVMGKTDGILMFRTLRESSTYLDLIQSTDNILIDTTPLGFALASKADGLNAALTGNPTAPTASASDNDTSIATTAYVNARIAAGSSTSYTKFDPDAPYTTPSAFDDEFNSGVLNAKWTPIFTTTAPVTNLTLPGTLKMSATDAGISGITQAFGADEAKTFRVKIQGVQPSATTDKIGLLLKHGTNYYQLYSISNTNSNSFAVGLWSNLTTFSSSFFSTSTGTQPTFYLEMRYTTTPTRQLGVSISFDGLNWLDIGAGGTFALGATVPSEIGIGFSTASGKVYGIEWFRQLQGTYTGKVVIQQ